MIDLKLLSLKVLPQTWNLSVSFSKVSSVYTWFLVLHTYLANVKWLTMTMKGPLMKPDPATIFVNIMEPQF